MNLDSRAQQLTDEQIDSLFLPCFASIQNLAISESRPLLAHYTSLEVLEKIMANDEVWFSNPLFMNDMQEMQFGMDEGLAEFGRLMANGELEATCGSAERTEILRQHFSNYWHVFNLNHALDVYVFCLSEHDPKDNDGRLSMWRGYGGNGNGAALIFNTDFLTFTAESPLLFGKVQYDTDDGRRKLIAQNMRDALKIIATNTIPDDKLYIAAFQIFNLIVVYSLISKHKAFSEEQEWRIIYFPNRDTNGLMKNWFNYTVGPRGIEPKLKSKIQPLPIDGAGEWTFGTILNRIILGPTQASELAARSIGRMLDLNKKSDFKDKLVRSAIPFRLTK
jgi:hypothetical protein